ncbi:hypothetical protein ABT297_34405 [Dactylosporangium sp. NPDC000555]|uniref:hypothetical protein n=1 Tax=Dactylosporangium sp. NPDC000555 TaxID=3154260 RepID=UPI00331F10DA
MEFTAFLIALVAVAALSSVGAWIARCRSADTAIGGVAPRGERDEAVLAEWLLAGYLSADQYRRDMAVLAARDARRHPLVTPPDR